eukprot:325033_1
MADHRKQRYYITFAPLYVIFIIFAIFVCLFMTNRMNHTTVSHIDNPSNVQARTHVSQLEREALRGCGIELNDIYGWFDALSFDFERREWTDYSSFQNHINSTYITDDIKLGLFKPMMSDSEGNDLVYLYGDKMNSIQMPPFLNLTKRSYSIITVARYNGNDRDTLFISNDKQWIHGFDNADINVAFHDGFAMYNANQTNATTQFKNEWTVSVDSPHLIRSQQETLYEDVYGDEDINDTDVINWGINIQWESDWAVATVLLLSQPLSTPQTECIETFFIQKYDLNSNHSKDANSNNDYVTKQRIRECDRWIMQKEFDDDIVAWYDMNNGYDPINNTLYDLSKNSNDILLDENIKIGLDKLNQDFRYLYGTTTDTIFIPITIDMDDGLFMAVYYVARYNGNERQTILDDGPDDVNGFHCGFYGGKSGVCYWGFKRTDAAGTLSTIRNTISESEEDVYGDQWVLSSVQRVDCASYYCSQNCDTAGLPDNEYDQGYCAPALKVSINNYSRSDWAFTEIIMIQTGKPGPKENIYFHPFLDTMCIGEYLSNKYNIDSYRYNTLSIFLLSLLNLPALIMIITAGVIVNNRFKFGGWDKMNLDVFTQVCQSCGFCEYCFCRETYVTGFACDCFCNFGGAVRACPCMNCCCGALPGPCGKHCCGCNVVILPIYNLSSALSSIVSILYPFIQYLMNHNVPICEGPSIWKCVTRAPTRLTRACKKAYKPLPTVIYLLLNACATWFATIIHFIFTYQYLIGDTQTLDNYPFFYFFEFEICIFIWCIMLLDSIRNSTHKYSLYWTVVIVVYAHLILVLFITIKMYYKDIHWAIQDSIYILSCVECAVIFIILRVGAQMHMNYWLFVLRSVLLVLLMIIVVVPNWDDVYKLWLFSFVLTQYLNLFVGDFMEPSTTDPKEYRALHPRRRDAFQSMLSNANYHQYQQNIHVDWVYDDSKYDSLLPMPIDCSNVQWICQPDDRTQETDDDSKYDSLLPMAIDCSNVQQDDLCARDVRVISLLVRDRLVMQRDRTNNDIVANHAALKHEYESNNMFTIDEALLSILRTESKFHQSKKENQCFDIDDIMIILIFVKFPPFRIFFNQNLLNSQRDCIHLDRKMCFTDCSLPIEHETKTGYTILNGQIASSSPIIFCEDINKISHFASATDSNFQGLIFRVTVCGRFASISLLGDALADVYMVFVPKSIEIISDAKHKAQMCRDVLKLDQAIDDKSAIKLKQILQDSPFLLMVDILTNVLILYRGHDIETSELKSLSELLIKLDDIDITAQVLFNIRDMEINMKAFSALIWLELMKHEIDKMAIIKLRRICHQLEWEEEQFVGKVLLEYQTDGVFQHLHLQQMDWQKYMMNYISRTLRKVNTLPSPLTAKRMSLEKRVEKCVDIMQRYDAIINHEAEKEESKYDELNVVELQALFKSIDDEFGTSQLLDTVFDLKQETSQYAETIRKHHECKRMNKCNILKSIIKTRSYGLRSRIPYRTKRKLGRNQKLDGVPLSAREFCVMELLDFVHIKLFHKEEHYRSQLPNRAGITAYEEEHAADDNDDTLFMDSLTDPYLQVFCAENEYDSDAIHNDILVADSDGICNKNIYFVFKSNHGMKEYHKLKQDMAQYTVKPPDEATMNRFASRLMNLDFGVDVTEWNVIPAFLSVKGEWLGNKYAPIGDDFYESLYEDSALRAGLHRNTSTYNLSVDEMLRIKMYTDTTKMQAEFRKAFRTSSSDEIRQQFVHWAMDLNLVFIKIEVLNIAYEYNKNVSGRILYHGLDRLFNTHGLVNQFYGALSTTPALSVAQHFAGSAGMVLEINKDLNFKHANAIAVHWISCHANEEEVLLMNPQVIIQQSYVFLKDTALKTTYLKEILLSVLICIQNATIFHHLSAFFQSRWIAQASATIASCLECMVKDPAFIEQIDIFAPRKCLKGMTLFEFIFFECRQYQIATYLSQYEYRTEQQIFEILIGSDLFRMKKGWVQSVNRSTKYCAIYQPLMCTMKITYEYSKHHKIVKSFPTKEGKQMLLDTNLILQHIDQRRLNTFQKGVTVRIDMEIKYQHKYHNGTKCTVRIWRYKLNKCLALTKKNFYWRIRNNVNLTSDTLCVSSLWISDNSVVTCASDCNVDNDSIGGRFRIFCAETLTIDDGSSISMDDCGAKGAFCSSYETSTPYNGKCGVQCGGGGGYTEKGQDGLIDDEKVDGSGGNKYLTHEIMQNNKDPMRLSIGFGGGCGDSVGSKGGNGGGKIYVLCNELRIKDGGKITANGGNGTQYGGGGSGGSILVTANQTNIESKNVKKKLSVIGGMGDNGAGNGSEGIIQFGVIDESPTLTFVDKFVPNNANIAMYGMMNTMMFD